MTKSDKIQPGSSSDRESEVEESTVIGSDSYVGDEEYVEEVEAEVVDSEVDRAGKVVSLLPVHAAPHTGKHTLKVTRSRGRPRKVERMPTTSDLEYHARITEEKARHIESDPVVRATSSHADSADTLYMVKLEVAKEAAALHFQRIENEKYGKDTSQVSTRRIDALGKIASIELEIKKLGANTIDLKSEKMQRVLKFLIGKMREVAEETLQPEVMDMYFNRLSTALEGWEEECAALIASKGA